MTPVDPAGASRPSSGIKTFEAFYAGKPGGGGWEINRPQPAFEELARSGEFRGRVLDAGCGTGENALMTAALGLSTTGVDAAPSGIATAEHKARERGLRVRFLVHDMLDIAALGEQFDTVLDCGLFHCFGDKDRPVYVDNLRAVIPEGGRYFMMCVSDQEPGTWGPRRTSRATIEACFAAGWQIDTLELVSMDVAIEPWVAAAWLTAVTRIHHDLG